MKKGISFLVGLALSVVLMCVSFVAFGDVPAMPVDPTAPLDTAAFIQLVIASIGSFKGASVVAIVAIVSQLILALFRTPLANFAGKYKLLIILSLALVGTFVTAMAGGASWSAALISNATMAAFQVLLNQIWKQFVTKASETATK